MKTGLKEYNWFTFVCLFYYYYYFFFLPYCQWTCRQLNNLIDYFRESVDVLAQPILGICPISIPPEKIRILLVF